MVVDIDAIITETATGLWKVQVMSALDEKIGRFCAEYALSPQQTRIFEALMNGSLSNEALGRACGIRQRALHSQLERIARKTMTVSRTELLYLFYEGRRGR